MSKTGAAERAAAALRPLAPPAPTLPDPAAVPRRPASRLDASDDDFFIPDFCATRMVFAVVLVAELLALTLSLARPTADFLTELARDLDVPAVARPHERSGVVLCATLAQTAYGRA